MARASAGYSQQRDIERRKAFLNALKVDLPGYDIGDQARAYVAAGAPKINAQFAQGVANADPATQGFVNQVNLRDYLKLAGGQPDQQTADLISQGDPAGLAALSELRKRLGV